MTDDDAGDEVLWLPEAAPGRLACLDVAIVSPDGGGLDATSMPVDGFMLGTGEAVLVLYSAPELTKEHALRIGNALSRAQVSPETRDNLAAADSPRMGLFGYDESSGLRIVWDLRVISPGAVR